ncbi:MAG: NAD(P)H-hydrate dehydratase [Rhodoferax sp.]|nr:NAD(P)H-hydrate dehydratase [Rhodoferax sp.]MCF8210883.1 NAD(P)H-hydrate dehydratase [Rhodoferax sp.]
MQRLNPQTAYALHSVQATRAIEQSAFATVPPHTLMQRAGRAVADLACAIAPHARGVWLACGPGNNGGDGLEAAVHLQQRGYQPTVTWLGTSDTLPADAKASWRRAVDSGVRFADAPPVHADLCIDALLGIGSSRAPAGHMAKWISHMRRCCDLVLAVDVPTGLDADTGACTEPAVQADHTLSLLTLKPGLFTASGRDAAGQVWWESLDVPRNAPAIAFLAGRPAGAVAGALTTRPHASHKGSRGDVAVVGGASGMTGAAVLAASAALHAGAGRVYVSLLDPNAAGWAAGHPELMLRPFAELALDRMTVVCGCGGGKPVTEVLAEVIQRAQRLVLDADALNVIAADTQMQTELRLRARPHDTVLTPHPLEAARLLAWSTQEVQAQRLVAAQTIAERFACTVVLKGSGSITAAPGQAPIINPTGNGLLATAGTGDVLAGLLGSHLAAGLTAWEAAWTAGYTHGQIADDWPSNTALTAGALARALR